MSVLTTIKGWFSKELASIIAPLTKIHQELDNFITKIDQEIQINKTKVEDLLSKNALKQEEQVIAAKVKDNIKQLLGKL